MFVFQDNDEERRNEKERNRRNCQTGRKQWRNDDDDDDDVKGMKTNSDFIGTSGNYSSPNYENITQNQIINVENDFAISLSSPDLIYEKVKTENYSEMADKISSCKKRRRIIKTGGGDNVDDGDGDEENDEDEKDAVVRDSKFKNDEIVKKVVTETVKEEKKISPTGNRQMMTDGGNPGKKRNWNKKIDETKLIKEFSYQYIKDPKVVDSNPSGIVGIDGFSKSIVKNRIKQLGLDELDGNGKDGFGKESNPINYYIDEAYMANLKNADSKLQEISLFALGESHPQCKEPSLEEVPEEKHQKSVKDLLADFEKKSQLAQERDALDQEKSFEDVSSKRCVFSDTETLLYDTSSDTEDKKIEPNPSILTNLKKFELADIEDELTEEEEGEEDRDEEVVAALSRRERIFSSCREMNRKKENGSNHKMKKLTTRLPDAKNENSPCSDIERIMSPVYAKSSLSESVTPLDNCDSTCVTPTIEKIKDNLEKTLPKENLTKKIQPEVSKEDETCENHYMPMTPSRRISAPPSDKSRSDSSLHSFLFGVDMEETYVEMTENGVASTVFDDPSKLFPERNGSKYCDVSGNKSVPHYDFLPSYRTSGSIREPEYMEVNTLLEILKEQDEKLKEHRNTIQDKSVKKTSQDVVVVPPTPPRSALPDILNSSTNRQNAKSDSSDADDESSKDLDSLDIPRHPRFSLSDTFRPASYYLGSAINDRDRNIVRLPNSSVENHDSSDSDLVSPPPIPNSLPPLDDLDTSLETERSLEINKPQNFTKFKQMDKEESKKLWSTPANNNINQENLDNSEDSKKKKRRPVSEDMLETLDETEQFFYEKPLVFSELDFVGNRSGLALDDECGDINLDQYLEELQLNSSVNTQLYTKSISENIYKSSEKDMHKNLMSSENMNKMTVNGKNLLKMNYANESNSTNTENVEHVNHERTKSNDEVHYENLQTLFPPPPPELYESSNEQSDRESNLTFYRGATFPEVPPPDNYCDSFDSTDKSKICFDPDTLQHQIVSPDVSAAAKTNSSFENQGAPYYYSDIIKNDKVDFTSSAPTERTVSGTRGHTGGGLHRYQQLNNQRDSGQEAIQLSKRNDIGRKVNPISQNYLGGINSNEANELDEVDKIAAELRTTSAHFMGAADKSGTVDMRNIYESDTLQRKKIPGNQTDVSGTKTPDMHHSQGVARNLYPQGIKNKFSDSGIMNSSSSPISSPLESQSRIRSRSVEGLLTDSEPAAQNQRRTVPTQHQNSPSVPSTSNSNTNSASRNHHPYEGDDLWDKDTLWRENLRKVSLRHTRSLDNLDDDVTWNSNQRQNPVEGKKENSGRSSVDHFTGSQNGMMQTGRRSADHFSLGTSKNKLSRNVTYVNDVVVRRNRSLDLTRECDENVAEREKIKPIKEMETVVVLSDSGILDCDDGVHYEKLTRNPPPSKLGSVPAVVTTTTATPTTSKWTSHSRENSKEIKRNAGLPMGKDVALKKIQSSRFPNDNNNISPVQTSNEKLPVQPLEREKLKQWDCLMSNGSVANEQVLDEKKMKNVGEENFVKDLTVKKSSEDVETVTDSDKYPNVIEQQQRQRRVVPEKKSQESTPSLEGKKTLEFLLLLFLRLFFFNIPRAKHFVVIFAKGTL